MSMGNRIRAARTAAGMSQLALALQLNVSSRTVRRWEQDLRSPHVSDVMRLASILGVNGRWVVFGTGPRSGKTEAA